MKTIGVVAMREDTGIFFKTQLDSLFEGDQGQSLCSGERWGEDFNSGGGITGVCEPGFLLREGQKNAILLPDYSCKSLSEL